MKLYACRFENSLEAITMLLARFLIFLKSLMQTTGAKFKTQKLSSSIQKGRNSSFKFFLHRTKNVIDCE